jgi:RNA polymerase sigma-70 factor (ECF subfamily)
VSDRRRFEELYAACSLRILGYFLRRVADRGEAADLMAETYVVAWRRIRDLPPGDGAVPWLFGIARFVLANARRHELAERRLTGRLRAELQAQLPDHGPRTELGVDLMAALEDLAPASREVLLLAALEELTPAEIALVVGMTPGAVRTSLHRSRASLAALRPSPASRGADGS